MSFAAIGAAIAGSAASALFSDGGASGPEVDPLFQKAQEKGLTGLDQYITNILGGTSLYSKDAAILDAQGAVANLFNQYKNNTLPEIYQAQNLSGGYNGSTSQLLANDAFAATTAKAAALNLDAIQKYRKIQQDDYTILAQLISSIKGASSPGRGADSATSGLLGQAVGSGVGAIINQWNKTPLAVPTSSGTIQAPDDYGQYF